MKSVKHEQWLASQALYYKEEEKEEGQLKKSEISEKIPTIYHPEKYLGDTIIPKKKSKVKKEKKEAPNPVVYVPYLSKKDEEANDDSITRDN